MPGGMLMRGPVALYGPQAVAFFEGVRADTLFLAVEGVDARGLTVPDVVEAHTKRAMVRSAHRIVIVADHSKLGRLALTVICALADVHLLITGKEGPVERLEPIREQIEVLQV
jgi:DeoR family fructose operon transcriptional repressor